GRRLRMQRPRHRPAETECGREPGAAEAAEKEPALSATYHKKLLLPARRLTTHRVNSTPRVSPNIAGSPAGRIPWAPRPPKAAGAPGLPSRTRALIGALAGHAGRTSCRSVAAIPGRSRSRERAYERTRPGLRRREEPRQPCRLAGQLLAVLA